LAVADECCKNKVVAVLEGGYDLEALSTGVGLMVRELLAVAD
jgi:acetoin utilization deacetylase AcuC-like enzyme